MFHNFIKRLYIIFCFYFLALSSANSATHQLLTIPSTKDYDHAVVRLQGVKISKSANDFFKSRLNLIIADNEYIKSNLQSRIDLGMNGVPILDQGEYPTCVIFAVTAALDAALGQGEHVSQLCLLKLGNSLSQHTYTGNPWDGSFAEIILSLIRDYGVISKAAQLQGKCGIITEYPTNPQDYKSPAYNELLSPENYHRYSSQVLGTDKTPIFINYHPLFRLFDDSYDEDPDLDNGGRIITISNDKNRSMSPNKALLTVKKALSKNRRVLLGFLISSSSNNVTPAHYKMDKDTWFLTDALKDEVMNPDKNNEKAWFYHEIVLYGYDDNAIAIMPNGSSQKGLFYVRNSWGTKRPYNQGIEFMTYDYFKMMATDAISIVTIKK